MYRYENVSIIGELTQEKFNKTVQRLITNDNSMTYQTKSPTVWECKWYDVANDKNGQYGYSKGDAVWLNTKDTDEFVDERKDEIIEYVKLYSYTNRRYQQISSDATKTLEFLKGFVTGENDYDNQHKYIFYIGNISCATQIRISKVDNNTSLPTDDTKWEDFIDRSYDGSFYEYLILSILEEQQIDKTNKHLINYHLSGIVDNNGIYKSNDELAYQFLDKSMSNVQESNSFRSHKYTTELSGFDFIEEYQTVKYSNGCKKWFRKWRSGLLEHGGIITVDGDIISEDGLYYGDQFYQVTLNWKYGTKNAKTYDYPSLGIGTFYMMDNQIDTGYVEKYPYEKQAQQLDWEYRYQISITPINDSEEEIKNPYYFSLNATTPHYTIKEVTNMTNNSFRFKYSENFSKYSYYIRGFVKNV